ncbi:hypothetical protein HJC23_003625 [Cyclotella cryptica]|uniref:Uncharacterized protein n=1 Tax=Cyclotella cryptica TaxID=29204 RepID=A0ABD3QJI0_9STRA
MPKPLPPLETDTVSVPTLSPIEFDSVKLCLTLMVTAVLEVSRGVKNLWLYGASAGMKSYPNYGQYIPIDYMKAFLHGLPYMWAYKKYYDVEPNMLPFDCIQPFVDEYNKLR